jgi:hypothetical protein
MKTETENKLKIIENFWRHFIWEYSFCRRKINFSKDIPNNYVGIILGYFQDTFDVVFKERKLNTYDERFAYNISLLQTIYVHQDFVEELLIIFKCGKNKGDLKKDNDYSKNREIRNELVGHPIRKIDVPKNDYKPTLCDKCGNIIDKPKNKSVLLSSALFGYDSDNNSITYLKYHRDNNYEFEAKSYIISEIIERHKLFLNQYFDIIINKSKNILSQFEKEINNILKLCETADFETILNVVSINFESIFKSDYIYDKKSLLQVYKKRNEHIRYQHLIEKFIDDLKNNLIDTKRYVKNLFEPEPVEKINLEKPIFKVVVSKTNNQKPINKSNLEESYNYELGKIGSNRNLREFEMYSGFLKIKCADNKLVMDELNHMKININSEIEFYSSFKLICKELKE